MSEASRVRVGFLGEAIPEAEEVLLQPARVRGLAAFDESGKGELSLDRPQDLRDRRPGLVAEIKDRLDLPAAQILGQSIRRIGVPELGRGGKWKRRAVAPNIADRPACVPRERPGEILDRLAVEVAHDDKVRGS